MVLVLKSKEKLWRSQTKDLEKFLGVVPEPLEDDLITVQDTRMLGTCQWFSTKQSYMKWTNFASDVPGILWVNGNPATGKSVLAGYAVEKLRKTNASCSYFFFKHGDKSKSRLSACLRSLAFQMACTKMDVREIFLEMQKDDITFDNNNERTIWRKLFSSGIFQTKFSPHYWVIDALDECSNFASFFDVMLTKLDISIPLRILVLSRETSELEKSFSNLAPHRVQSETILITDTLPDIKLLVDARAGSLAVKNGKDRIVLGEKILNKSKGPFLWTVLVLNELSSTYGEEEINQVLDDVPRDMEPLYQRILELMSQLSRGKRLAKAILTWATCAIRPLITEELDGALQLDIKDGFANLKDSIVALCGQLVTVDKFAKVQMVHETAREFLLNENLKSEFAINKIEAHTQIARVCLQYLAGEEMKPPRNTRRGSTISASKKRAKFSLYACTAFSYHLSMADPLANDILILVDKFLKSNILSWIESIAQTKNLTPLIRTARNLRTYFNSCAAQRSPLGGEIRNIKGWITDLVRIAARFAEPLITLPSAIYGLILPFCPTESTVYKTAIPGRKLSVVGLSNVQWDDRLSCVDFHQGQTSAVCHGDDFFAVGLNTGTVAVYYATSCQEYKILNHGEAVRLLQFKSKTDLMVSCGMKTIRIWDVRSGQIIHHLAAPPRPIELSFDKNLLMVASSKNYLALWDLNNGGAQMPNRPWSNSGDRIDIQSHRLPCAISISMKHKMMAIAYDGQPITLWDLEEDTYYGSCGKKLPSGETSTHRVTALVFNPNPAIGLLVASYLDGDLVLLDPFDDQDLESFRANCHTLAANPDGRLLAGSAGSGTIEIYEFDTLRLLYRIKSSNSYIKQLVFSKDSLHFADIRGSQCNIWEPAVLLRDFVGDDSSESTSVSLVEASSFETKAKISAMILYPRREAVFCGKDDGSVSLYSLKTGSELRTLYCHKSLVRILAGWLQADVILSVDVSNAIFAWSLKKSQEGWMPDKLLFQSRLDCESAIVQVLLGHAAGKFILSTRESDHLWTIDGLQQEARTYSDKPGIRNWMQHQYSPLHVVCIEGAAAHIHTWKDWSKVASISFTIDMTGLQLKSITPYSLERKQLILLELCELNGSMHTHGLHLLDATSFSIESIVATEAVSKTADDGKHAQTVSIGEGTTSATISVTLLGPQLATLARYVTHLVGIGESGKLVFLDKRSWVCSVDLGSLDNASLSYSRHFFVPYDWFAGTRDIICALTQREIVFARNNDVAVVKGGLEYVENIDVEIEGAESNMTTGLSVPPAAR